MKPADFYTGIVADLYAPLKSASHDPKPYQQFIADIGEPALELGCGDGDPLLYLRRHAIDVDGVDSSADMLERCVAAAHEQNISVTVYHQRMESLDLPRVYRSIFLAGPTFNLLPDDETALRALHGIKKHLANDGTALIPLFTPTKTPKEQYGITRRSTAGDGTEICVSVTSEDRDDATRTQTTMLRYERKQHGKTETVDRPWVLHWYPRHTFTGLAETAGLTVTSVTADGGKPASEHDTDLWFYLRHQ